MLVFSSFSLFCVYYSYSNLFSDDYIRRLTAAATDGSNAATANITLDALSNLQLENEPIAPGTANNTLGLGKHDQAVFLFLWNQYFSIHA